MQRMSWKENSYGKSIIYIYEKYIYMKSISEVINNIQNSLTNAIKEPDFINCIIIYFLIIKLEYKFISISKFAAIKTCK